MHNWLKGIMLAALLTSVGCGSQDAPPSGGKLEGQAASAPAGRPVVADARQSNDSTPTELDPNSPAALLRIPEADPVEFAHRESGESESEPNLGLRPVAARSTTEDANQKKAQDKRRQEITAAFDRLVAARENPDPAVWDKAFEEIASAGAQAAPVLAEALTRKDTPARELAAMVLASLGPDAAAAKQALIDALADDWVFVRLNAASALTSIGDGAEPAIPVLIELLSHPEPDVRLTAIMAIGNTGDLAQPTIEPLIEQLTSTDARLQLAAVQTLGRLGKVAEPALPKLRELAAGSTEVELRTAIDEAVQSINPE